MEYFILIVVAFIVIGICLKIREAVRRKRVWLEAESQAANEAICKTLGHIPDKSCQCARCHVNAHDWDGCKCKTCGSYRRDDVGHDWDGCKCKKCGSYRQDGAGHTSECSWTASNDKRDYGYYYDTVAYEIESCIVCGKQLKWLKHHGKFCKICHHPIIESELPYTGTSFEYEYECSNCGYTKTRSVNDSY